jgi:hypothetical protein
MSTPTLREALDMAEVLIEQRRAYDRGERGLMFDWDKFSEALDSARAALAQREARPALTAAQADRIIGALDPSDGGHDGIAAFILSLAASPQEAPVQSDARPVTPYNVGRWCLSEDECRAGDIDFASYERGISDAALAFGMNK